MNATLTLGIGCLLLVAVLFVFWKLYHHNSRPKDNEVSIPKHIEEEINARLRIEEWLINKNKQLKWAETAAKICYCHWDLTKDIITFSDGVEGVLNVKADRGYSGNEIKAIIIPEDRLKMQRFIESLETGITSVLVLRIIADGKLRYIKTIAEKYTSDKDTHIFHGTFQDVTDEQMFIRRIEDKNELLKQIAWSQSHEVRAPLVSLLGLISVINEEEFKDEHNKIIISGLKESALALDDIIKKIVKRTEASDVDLD